MSFYRNGAMTQLPHKSESFYSMGASGLFGSSAGADIYQEMETIHTEMVEIDSQLKAELTQLVANGGMTSDPRYVFWISVWSPFFKEWRDFANDKNTWLAKAKAALSLYLAKGVWDDLQDYRKRLIAMHSAALAVGFTLKSPPPTAPKQNMFDDVADKFKDGMGEIWKILKFVLYGIVIVIGGVTLLWAFTALKG